MENDKSHNKGSEDKISEILGRIERNELVPLSKMRFHIRLALLIALGIAVLLISVLLISFIFYSIRAEGRVSLIGFGQHGFAAFAADFPWSLFAADLVLVAVFCWLLRSFRFGYKSPVLYVLLGALGVIAVGGYVVDEATPLHDSLMRHADERNLPAPFDGFYESLHKPPQAEYGIYRGKVTSVDGDFIGVALDNARGVGTTTLIKVLIPASIATSSLVVGSKIFIDGDEMDGIIKASEVRVIH